MNKFYKILVTLFFAITAGQLNAQVVINEVYGGGGNSGSVYKNDFIELYNNGNTSVNLTGWSIQYASATGSTWQITSLSGSIPANGFYLIKEAAGTGGTTDLPPADATGNIALSGTAGKIVLVNNAVALTVGCPPSTSISDLVGFGATANCFEGAGPTIAPSNTNSVQRTPIGFDSNENSLNFSLGLPSPTGTSAGVDTTPPTILSYSPQNNSVGVAQSFSATVNFSENVKKGAGNILVKRSADNSTILTIPVSSSNVDVLNSAATFRINGLQASSTYYIEIEQGAFSDIANNGFGGLTGESTWKFTTGSKLYSASFNFCSGGISEGFSQFSVMGAQVWGCTTFGRDNTNLPSGSAPNGLQINGFDVTNVSNEDWLISPAFDLSSTTYPLLTFWSRTAFNGDPLEFKVSTNYTGTGDPRLAIWTDLNGRFPNQASDVWTLSSQINLSGFKQPKVYFAFVYKSTIDDGARWTLDDIAVDNSSTPPAAALTVNTNDIQFNYVSPGSAGTKSFTVIGNDITTPLNVSVGNSFLVSKDNVNYSSLISFPVVEANNLPLTIYTRFVPTSADRNYNGVVTVTTSGITDSVGLTGTTIDPAKTLEVVNWNVEWFGSTTFGPTNDSLQEQNIKSILRNIDADLFGLVEVVDTARLGRVVRSMQGYSFVVSNFGSHTNPTVAGDGPLSEAQKLAFVYKSAMFSNITTTPLLSAGTNTAADANSVNYNNWSSGRYPYMMSADVLLNGITKNIKFILVHAKANTSPTVTSYNRRRDGADSLYKLLNTSYLNDNIMMLGDFNDDLDSTITAGITPKLTSYRTFVNDSVNYPPPTLVLSRAGKKSTVGYNDMIDHVILSNEMKMYYMANSANVLNDVNTIVSAYSSTTTDHYPVFSRYAFDASVLPVKLLQFTATKSGATVKVDWKTAAEINTTTFEVQRSSDGVAFTTIANIAAAGATNIGKAYEFLDNTPMQGVSFYRIRQVDNDQGVSYSNIASINFKTFATLSIKPNPTNSYLEIDIEKNPQDLMLNIIDFAGRKISSAKIVKGTTSVRINVSGLSKGTYLITVSGAAVLLSERVVVN